MTDVFAPVQQVRLTREVANQIARMIVAGDLPPSSKLPSERDLALKLNVSRPTLREALHILESLSLVHVRAGGGTYVSPMPSGLSSRTLELMIERDSRLLTEITEVRREFEARNAKLAATKATPEEIARLADVLRAMEHDIQAGRDDFERDLTFHLIIAEATRNRIRLFITSSVLMAYFESLKEGRRQIVHREIDAPAKILEEHRTIYNAIEQRNPKAAAYAMEAHLGSTYRRYFELDSTTDGEKNYRLKAV